MKWKEVEVGLEFSNEKSTRTQKIWIQSYKSFQLSLELVCGCWSKRMRDVSVQQCNNGTSSGYGFEGYGQDFGCSTVRIQHIQVQVLNLISHCVNSNNSACNVFRYSGRISSWSWVNTERQLALSPIKSTSFQLNCNYTIGHGVTMKINKLRSDFLCLSRVLLPFVSHSLGLLPAINLICKAWPFVAAPLICVWEKQSADFCSNWSLFERRDPAIVNWDKSIKKSHGLESEQLNTASRSNLWG